MSEARKNLLSGTRDWSGEWQNSMDWHADGTHDGFTVMSRKFAWSGLSKPVKLVAGKTYTFSACVKVDPGQDHVVGIYLAISGTGNDTDLASSEIDDSYRKFHDVADGGWHIISHTFTPTASKCVRARVEANGDFALSVCAYMLVEGSTPAAWAPAEGEALTADGGGGAMTEPTNLVKTQPDENATYTVKAAVHGGGGHTDVVRGNVYIKLSANTSFHIGITIKPDKDIPSGRVWSWINYKDDAGAENFANSSVISYVIPAGVWTRLEWTVTVPAGMTLIGACISFYRIADETKFQATNFAVYPLTGGRIVRARGANDGSKPTGVMTWNGTKGTLKTKEYSVDDVCIIQSDSNLKCINFVFE